MFTNLFKKENNVIVKKEKNYPEIVTTIHNEFNNAAEVLFEEAMTILNKNNDKTIVNTINKVNRMKSIGFNTAKQVDKIDEIVKDNKISKETINTINQARIDYPLYKFITLEQIKIICKKYDLIFGGIDRFEGFVPEANLKEIEIFLDKYTFKDIWMIEQTIIDMSGYEVRKCNSYKHFYPVGERSTYNNYIFQSDDNEEEFYGSDTVNGIHYDLTSDFKGRLTKETLQICAPLKDMNIDGMEIRDRVLRVIEDPIVLQPIKGGYLIVTAWGDEASDPLIKNNEILN